MGGIYEKIIEKTGGNERNKKIIESKAVKKIKMEDHGKIMVCDE
jgi:hypothetical protein